MGLFEKSLDQNYETDESSQGLQRNNVLYILFNPMSIGLLENAHFSCKDLSNMNLIYVVLLDKL